MATAPQLTELEKTTAPAVEAGSLSRSLFSGTSSIGVAVSMERGLGFIAHLLAARIGGTHIFGTYSLALTTANSVAAYAGAGIGTTANRFSGMYPYGTPEYTQLQRTLAMVSAQSALVAAALLWAAAGPIASRLIGNPSLTPLLHLAALSSAAIILLECMRGFLIGQRRYAALLALSLCAGGGMLLLIPATTFIGPKAMIGGQATAAAGAVVVCMLFARKLGVMIQTNTAPAQKVRVSTIWLFGFGQLLGVIGLNAAGWWTASLVSRADQTMVQMSFYIAAQQLRNVIAMAPGLVQQACYALLTEEAGAGYGGPDRVLIASTLFASVLALLLTGTAIAVLPWILGLLFGNAFRGAEAAAAISIATALVHMAAAPAASRLTILSLRMIGVVNGIWAVAVIALGPLFIPAGGAVPATSIMLGMHLVSAILVLACLKSKSAMPRSLVAISIPMIVGSLLFGVMGWLRFAQPELRGAWSAAIFALTMLLIAITMRLGQSAGCIPSLAKCMELALAPARGLRARRAAC